MTRKIKIGLVDGLPFKTVKNTRVVNIPEIIYPWDSELFGVPEYRAHADKMIGVIHDENPDVEITVYPFYPKFNSVRKDYHLMAKSIEKAVDHKSDVICICLEVVGAKYLSADMLKAYKHASCQGIVICVSAGNNRPFLNPLIHKKYTIPIVGLTKDNEIPIHLKPENYKTIFGIGVYGGRNHGAEQVDEKIYCSAATARFAALLSKVLTKQKISIDLKKINTHFKKYSYERIIDNTSLNL